MQVHAATTALVSTLLVGSQGFQLQGGFKETTPSSMSNDNLYLRQPARRMPVQCRITSSEADKLVRHAVLDHPLSNRDEILSRVKTPGDIYRSGVSTARLLSEINAGVPDEVARKNNLKALFLRDKLGQCVVTETLKTWGDKWSCLVGILGELPQEIGRTRKPVPTEEQRPCPLSTQEAKQLAESFLSKTPLENREELLEKVMTFNDMVKVDGEASRLLDRMNEGLSDAKARKNTLKYLFLMHHVGMQVTRHMIQSPEEQRMYRQHLLEVLRPW